VNAFDTFYKLVSERPDRYSEADIEEIAKGCSLTNAQYNELLGLRTVATAKPFWGGVEYFDTPTPNRVKSEPKPLFEASEREPLPIYDVDGKVDINLLEVYFDA
jgi:hypothetical protein